MAFNRFQCSSSCYRPAWRTWLFLLGWSCGLAAFAAAAAELPIAHYTIDTWTTADGLPQNSVTAIAQTADGYLWLGTFNGLVRFDGTRFTLFDRDNVPALSDPQIRSLYADKQGRLWIIELARDLIRMEAGRFTREEMPNAMSKSMCELWEDAAGTLWLSSFGGDGALARWETDHFRAQPLPDGCPTNRPLRLWPELLGERWVLTSDRFGPLVNGRFVPLVDGEFMQTRDNGTSPPSERAPSWPFKGLAGGFWMKRTDGMQHLDSDGKISANISFPHALRENTSKFLEDRLGNIWVPAGNGELWRRDVEGRWSKLTSAQGLFKSIRSLFEDHEHGIWIGTDGGGLHRLRPLPFASYDERDGLSSGMTYTVSDDAQGTVWVGAFGGGARRMEGKRFVPFPKGEKATPLVIFGGKERVWVSLGGGNVFGLQNGEVVEEISKGNDPEIRALYEDSSGALWMGHGNGVRRWANGTLTSFGPDQGLAVGRIFSITGDRMGNIWMGSDDNALVKFNGSNFITFTERDGLPNYPVRALLADASDLWIGTYGGGLACLRSGKFLRCTMKDGLPDKVINSILDDGLGNLWTSGPRGVGRVARAELEAFFAGRKARVECDVFGERDGMGNRESRAGWKARDGRLWFPTLKGVSVVDPKSVPRNRVPPKTVVQEILVDGQLQSEPSPDALMVPPKKITIPPGKHRLEIAYAALSFARPEHNRYKYRLQGIDDDWVDAGNRRTASYSAVAPGTYDFEVIGSNNDYVWSNTSAALAIVVQPYIWQTNWFRVLSALLLMGGTAGFVRYLSLVRLRRRLAELERRHALENERARISRDLHDNLGADLSQLALWSELAAQEKDRPSVMVERVRSVSALAREVIQNVDEIVWTVNPKNDSLDRFAAYVCEFSERFVTGAGLRFRWEAPEHLPSLSLPSDTRHHLFLVIKEALNNIVKHARATEARVQLGMEQGRFVLAVSDNGCGLAAAASSPKSTGNGLANMRERIAQCGGQLTIESKDGEGATICISVPLIR